MSNTSNATVLLIFLCFLSFFNYSLCSSSHSYPSVVCHEREKQALLKFKRALIIPSNRLTSWSVTHEPNCCKWKGVKCDNITGTITALNIRNPYNTYENLEKALNSMLSGTISPALLELHSLTFLDMSWNHFEDEKLPSFLGSMQSLTYLNLSYIELKGPIPHQLGNLSNLRYLDLSRNSNLYVDKLDWMGRLYSLEYLDLSYIDLSSVADNWLQVITLFPSLSQLNLGGCSLADINNIPPLGYLNLTSLQVLDLSSNLFNSTLPDWLFNLSDSLVYLNLMNTFLYGPISGKISNFHKLKFLNFATNNLTEQIPEGLGQMKNLEYLTVESNLLDGSIPASIGNLSLLRTLVLATNQLNGPLPNSIGHLSKLEKLDLSSNELNGTLPKSTGLLSSLEMLYLRSNSFSGVVSQVNFDKLSKLKILDMSFNSMLIFRVSSTWIPPFQLEDLGASHCQMDTNFPFWLRTQTSLNNLDISRTGISDTAPVWFWKLASHIAFLDISYNEIRGDLSNVSLNSSGIDMSSNKFHGQLPTLSPNVIFLNIANNSVTGLVSSFLCKKMHRENSVKLLDASNNLLSGGLSSCWMYWPSLNQLNLGSNCLTGNIPESMGSLVELQTLHLHNNSLSRDIPLSLRNCTSLQLINLGDNEFTGLIPNWLGEITSLTVLQLRSNKFVGNIPRQLCQLSQLSILDIANNSMSGTIPACLNNISAMTTTQETPSIIFSVYGLFDRYKQNLNLVTKGRESEYNINIIVVNSIDLSSNNLSGPIPDEISSLAMVRFLNMSRNHLTGRLPERIGGMMMLESLDLSINHISGEIPQSMSRLTFLGYLDLSYNNFSGRIPLGTQIQGFDESRFAGNADLCGAPLSKNCTQEEVSQAETPMDEGGDEFNENSWFLFGLGPGFAAGFWGVCGVLFFNRTWRQGYYQFLEEAKDRIYVATRLQLNRSRKWFKR